MLRILVPICLHIPLFFKLSLKRDPQDERGNKKGIINKVTALCLGAAGMGSGFGAGSLSKQVRLLNHSWPHPLGL